MKSNDKRRTAEYSATGTVLHFSGRTEVARGNYRHKLRNILTITLIAIICGCEGWDEIWYYAQSKEDWLKSFLTLPNGIPSQTTLRRVFTRLKPESVEKVYREWITPYIGTRINKQIRIDGKTVCGVAKGSSETSNLHVVSAWVKEDGVCFGQIRTQEKNDEITAIVVHGRTKIIPV